MWFMFWRKWGAVGLIKKVMTISLNGSFFCSLLYIYLAVRKIYHFNYRVGLPINNCICSDRLCKSTTNLNKTEREMKLRNLRMILFWRTWIIYSVRRFYLNYLIDLKLIKCQYVILTFYNFINFYAFDK